MRHKVGLLVNGEWVDQWYDTKKTGGKFVRQDSCFRRFIKADGSTPYAPESGRYHLYIAHACPWANRTVVFRALKGLTTHISLSVVNPLMGDRGWTFEPAPGVVADPVHSARCLYEVYQAAQSDYTGRVTVPVLWDRQSGTIVSNESAEIIRMFNTEFNALPGVDPDLDFYPPRLRSEIDEVNADVYEAINNGVYKAGFASTQQAYDVAVRTLFQMLDTLEQRLATRRYLTGSTITEADWRLFTTLVRFDVVYHFHFKCNLRRIVDYPHLWGYVRELYQWPGVADTIDMDHVKKHYYASHRTINPHGIVPMGPDTPAFGTPHLRARVER